MYLKSDQREHTLCYFDGDPADQVVAFEVATARISTTRPAALTRLGHDVKFGTAAEADLRKVRAFIGFKDPSGNTIELVWRPAHSGTRYHGERDAGITGFSHVGLCTTDAVRDEHFWTTVCNARVSDRIGDAPLLRIDEIHHTIALFPAAKPGIQHINHQVESGDDIMRSYHFLRERNVRMVFGPGRHPTSSAKFLYFEGPDGMVYEYSSGVREICRRAALSRAPIAVQRRWLLPVGRQAGHPGVPQVTDPERSLAGAVRITAGLRRAERKCLTRRVTPSGIS